MNCLFVDVHFFLHLLPLFIVDKSYHDDKKRNYRLVFDETLKRKVVVNLVIFDLFINAISRSLDKLANYFFRFFLFWVQIPPMSTFAVDKMKL